MTSSTDFELLHAFSRDRDEKAFRVFAERHLSLIYHTALRRTGNHATAEDVVQNVLCAVARKSVSLTRRDLELPAWLHRATLFEASKAMRAEDSHHRRSQLQHPDDLPSTGGENSALWKLAEPHLDVALNQLPESDRRVLLLHFFENLSFPKIAARLSRSPAAIQKQSGRALEKLSKLLRGHGVALPVGVIVTGLAVESAKAAPAALLSKALPAAFSAASATATSHSLALMISSHQKGIAAGVLLLLALPACWQQLAIANTQRNLSALATALSVVPGERPSTNPDRRYPQITGSLQIDQLIREFRLARQSAPLSLALREKLAAAGFDKLSALLTTLRDESLPQEDRAGLANVLARAMAKTDLPGTMERIRDGWMTVSDATRGQGDWMLNLFSQWTGSDPLAAEGWLKEIDNQPDFLGLTNETIKTAKYYDADKRSQSFRGRPLEEFRAAALSGLVAKDAGAAIGYLETYPPDTWQAAIIWNAATSSAMPSDPVEAGNWLRVIRTLEGADRDVALKYLAGFNGKMSENEISPQQATSLIRADGAAQEERENLASLVIASYLKTKREPIRDTVEELNEWLSPLLPDSAGRIVAEARSRQLQDWDRQAGESLDQLVKMDQDSAGFQSALVHPLMAGVFKGARYDQALQMAEKIRQPEQREIVIKNIQNNSKR